MALPAGLERSWVRPELYELGRLPMRSPLIPFPDATAAHGARESSPWFRSLDGPWRFRLVKRPEDAPSDFAAPELEDAHWDVLPVPSNWTLHGHDRPHYTNVLMPFATEPPAVPDANPTGLYRRRFTPPEGWRGRRVVLHVGGAESVLYLWLNGSFVGLAKDSRLASEFDVTQALRAGENLLAAMVVRWSDASWLEDQDHWWMAGIHREVYLLATDRAYLADIEARAGLAGSRVGTLDLRVRVGFADAPERGWSVRARVETATGRALGPPLEGPVPVFERETPEREAVSAYLFRGHAVRLRGEFRGVAAWSAELPVRHRLLVELRDPEGRTREAGALWLGFRNVEIRGRDLLLNGRRVLIRGVNRHDFHPESGKVVPREELRRDVILIKQQGFNAVRTSHYPNDPHFLDLCDELGLWVIDEANLETHARYASLVHDPAYRGAILARVSRMVERDRNHPCVIGWSLGNESGYGSVHDAAAAWVRSADPTRFVHYEGAIARSWLRDPAAARRTPATDLICPMYPEIADLVRAARAGGGGKPIVMCEYSHAMGNSNGGLADYWDAIERTRGLQGGFIWDWIDQGLQRVDARGRPYFAYGGDFGERPHDGSFCLNGVVGPDRRPHPVAHEHRKLAAPVAVEAVDAERGRLRLRNRQDFRDLRWLRAEYQVAVDGAPVERGALALPALAPGASAPLTVRFRRPRSPPGGECHLTLRCLTRRDEPWAPRGFEVAWEQFALRLPSPGSRLRAAAHGGRRRAPSREAEIETEEGGGRMRARCGPRSFEIDLERGVLDGLALRDRPLLVGAPRLTLWRAPTDNDGIRLEGRSRPDARRRWLAQGLDRLRARPLEAKLRRTARGSLELRARTAWVGADPSLEIVHLQRLRIDPPGELRFDERIEVPAGLDDLPRVGIRLELTEGLEELEWFGRGPHESYPDRKRGARVGRFRGRVSDEYVPYVRPQEHGSHADTRWLALSDRGHSLGVLLFGLPLLSFSASHFAPEDLDGAAHTCDLEPRPEVIVHLDRGVRGLGTASCGPDTLPRYRVRAGVHRFGWRLRLFDPGRERPDQLARDVETSGARRS